MSIARTSIDQIKKEARRINSSPSCGFFVFALPLFLWVLIGEMVGGFGLWGNRAGDIEEKW